ncbi:hypothetical protein ACPA9J_21390 [Pseudomonas aeruginosa]
MEPIRRLFFLLFRFLLVGRLGDGGAAFLAEDRFVAADPGMKSPFQADQLVTR